MCRNSKVNEFHLMIIQFGILLCIMLLGNSENMVFFPYVTIIKCNRRGLPPNNDDILKRAQNLIIAHADKKNPSVNGRSGRKWLNECTLLVSCIAHVKF